MITETLEEVIAQRNHLMFQISEMAQALGITNRPIDDDGPMCLMVCSDIVAGYSNEENYRQFCFNTGA